MVGVQYKKTKIERIRNSRLLIDRFEARIPGFNRFSLSFYYWVEVCDAYGVKVLQRPMRILHGLAMQGKKRPYIIINSTLTGPEKVIAVGHEFTHITDQILETSLFLSTGNLWNLSKFDRQAQIVGVVGLIPEPHITGKTAEDLMRDFGIKRAVAEFRLSLRL